MDTKKSLSHNSLVSVIIPFYNRFNLVEEALNMLMEQTYPNFEVVLVNDGSEGYFELERLKSQYEYPIKYDKLQRNSGPGAARRRGRELAEGEYIAYLDSDDSWETDFLSVTVDINETNDCAMVFTNSLIRSENGKRLRLDMLDGEYDFFDLTLKKKLYWPTASVLWKKNVTLSDNWKPIRDHEDYVHDFLSIIPNSQIFYISRPLCIINKSPVFGIKRSNREMLRSLKILLTNYPLKKKLERVYLYQNFLDFILWKIERRKFSFNEFKQMSFLYYQLLLKSPNRKIVIKSFLKRIYY